MYLIFLKMEIKDQLREFLSEEGMVHGKEIIFNTIAALEKEYFDKVKTTAVETLEKEMFNKHLADLNIDVIYNDISQEIEHEYRTTIYRVSDPVEPTIVGNWDRDITEGKTYRVNSVSGDYIVIRDDSGLLRPYLKSRFINTSKYLPGHN
jgi:hypothetical protein